MDKIDVYTAGCCPKQGVSSYGAMLSAGESVFESAKKIGNRTKTQADMISIIMAMRCIVPDVDNRCRAVTLHISSVYAYQMLDRQDGEWVNKVRANAEIVNEARAMICMFPNLTIDKIDSKSPQIQRCVEIAKNA